MKLLAALFATLAIAVPAAFAATPQGKLSGGADLATTIGIERLVVNGRITDGEMVFVNVIDDKSNDCNGDSGAVQVTYTDGTKATTDIACAHFIGDSMQFEYPDAKLHTNVVISIRELGEPARKDVVHIATTTDDELALQWVNRGYGSSGAEKAGIPFPRVDASAGNYQVKA
jgi:hypothetical protein